MTRTFIIRFIAPLFFGVSAFAQIGGQPQPDDPAEGGMGEEIPCGFTPNINGTIQPDEWLPANYVPLTVGQNITMIGMMHDDTSLYFLFSGHLESNIRFPEIYIDVDNSKDSTWQADDWWFHVSATDCENMGAPDVFSNCQLIQPDWVGVNNIISGDASVTDTVEIAIPFSKIGYSYGSGDPMGIAFGFYNIVSTIDIYPQGGDPLVPATWLTVSVLPCNAGILEKEESFFTVFPNPAKDEFTLQFSEDVMAHELMIYSIDGNKVATIALNGSSVQTVRLPASVLPGIYMLQVDNNEKSFRSRLVIGQ